ncbi:MAG: hypothetical protein MJ152_05045 [Clostridia bacterium]|nr:hypothetical protein [Clostridia bacterium]
MAQENKKPLRYLVAYRLKGAKENDYKTALIFAYDKKEAGEILKRYADAKHLALNNVVFKRVRRGAKITKNDADLYNKQNKQIATLEAEAKKGAQA